MTTKQNLKQISAISDSVSFRERGGAITVGELAEIPFGSCSMIQNMRQRGIKALEQRGGQRKKHSTEEGISKFLNIYQFSKGKRTERHFFAQASDNDVLEAADAPPIVTTGKFGSSVLVETENAIPASWSNLDDLMFYSNGVDQHKVYAGTANYVSKFVKYVSADTAAPTVPTLGIDYTKEVTDGLTVTHAVLDSLNTYGSTYHCIFICTPVPANRLTWSVGKANATGAVGSLMYRKSDNTWADTYETDGTISSSATIGQTGSMTWDFPTDQIPSYMYGMVGFWYLWKTATQLDAEVEITSVTYGTDGKGATTPARHHFRDIVNLWSGDPAYAIEVRFYDQSATAYYNTLMAQGATAKADKYLQEHVYTTASGDLISIGGMDYDAIDYIYVFTLDRVEGFYFDIGDTPNTGSSTFAEDDISVWTGAGFTTVGALSGQTNVAFGSSGWVTFARQGSEQRTFGDSSTFGTSPYYLFCYRIKVSTADVSAGVQISIETMPYFDIAEKGIGLYSAPWKESMVYVFDRYPKYIHITEKNRPMVLNGPHYSIRRAGDGRNNKIVCMKKFYNELIAWQEDKAEGGTVTLFQGDKPPQHGELLLSSEFGTFSAKSAIVVDGVRLGKIPRLVAFWIAHKGVCITEGTSSALISQPIGNYFDSQKSECIRRGSEKEMWIAHDSVNDTINIGLVSGEPIMTSTATSTVPGKLVDTAGAFTTRKSVTGHPITHTIAIGDTVYNTTDDTTTTIRSINSATELTLVADIMVDDDEYEIYSAMPNLFPVLDLTTWTWSFDNRAQSLSCMTEVETATGNAPILQYAGGAGGDDAFVYQVNYGTNDVSTAIDAYAQPEFIKAGAVLSIRELMLTMKTQSAGDCTVTPYKNNVAGTALTLPMTAKATGHTMRRQRLGVTAQGEQLSLKIQNATVSQSLYLIDLGLEMYEKEGH